MSDKGGFPSGKRAKNQKFPCDFFAESILGGLLAVAAELRKGRKGFGGIFRFLLICKNSRRKKIII